MITTHIFIGLMGFNMVLSAYLIILFDGICLYFKGVRLFTEEYEMRCKYERIAYHVFEISRVAFVVLAIFAFIYFKGNMNI